MKMKEDMRPGDLRVLYTLSTLKCFRGWNKYHPPVSVEGAVILLDNPNSERTLSWKILTNQGIMYATSEMIHRYTYDMEDDPT